MVCRIWFGKRCTGSSMMCLLEKTLVQSMRAYRQRIDGMCVKFFSTRNRACQAIGERAWNKNAVKLTCGLRLARASVLGGAPWPGSLDERDQRCVWHISESSSARGADTG